MKVRLRVGFVFAFFLVTIFSVLKIYRNSLGYYNYGEGGIWNIFPLVFLIEGVFILFVIVKNKYSIPKSIKYALASAVLSQVHALFFWNSFSYYNVYRYLMITCYACVLIVFYIKGRHIEINRNYLICMYMIIAILIMAFISVYFFRTQRITFSMTSNVYYALCIFPFTFVLCKNMSIRYSISIFVGIIILLSGKRTGLIALLGFFVVSSFVNGLRKNALDSFFRTLLLVIVGGVVLICLNNYIQSNYDIDILNRMANLVKDGGSGRTALYRDIFKAVCNSDLQYIILGHGMNSTGNITALTTAHDDFLEILYDYGVGPTVLFAMFYVRLFREGVKLYKSGYKYVGYFFGGVFISLTLSLFSTYCVDFSYVACGMAFLGFALAQGEQIGDIQRIKEGVL